MFSTIDYRNSEKSYGYTEDNENNTWYWNFDGENLEFRDYGYPVNHPYHENEEIPQNVKSHAERYLDI